MLQTSRTTGLIAVLALCAAQAGAASSPAASDLAGRYEGGLGKLVVEADPGGRIIGRYGEGGSCRFDPRRPVLDGELEGNVLVGTVTLCQTGPACEERAYPILAFRSSDGTLAADVKLEPGCESPALSGRRLLLSVVPSNAPGGTQGNAVLASTSSRVRKTRAACIEDLKRGTLLLQKRDYAGAAYYFSEGLACNQDNWPAYLGIGIAELRRGRIPDAMEAFHRARKLSRAAGEEDPGIHFNLACGYTRMGDRGRALQSMERAVALGWADPKAMVDDPDLQPLRDDPKFKALVDRAWDLKDRQPLGSP